VELEFELRALATPPVGEFLERHGAQKQLQSQPKLNEKSSISGYNVIRSSMLLKLKWTQGGKIKGQWKIFTILGK
jgi:hypothetical protein